ncbi:hypothetical protein DW322_02205 [Rhodococcus rhodnii]|uniref:Uncharacterized protein n=1 Tax=Rhodococcus rhodnii TaxID=38312 RepID=A0A6P2C9F3_9NOCA|nr:hypothetical protein DW322_02205 [Rhodococcus rhodnii]
MVANLQHLPMISGRAEQFIGPAGSPAPGLASLPQYADLEIQSRSVACTNFDAFEHVQLVANVEPIQAEALEAFRQEWASAANTVADAFETFAVTIGNAISEKWQGASGEGASTAIVGYAHDSARLADASNLLARQIGMLSDSLSQTKSNLPPEPAATFPGKVAGFFGADGWDDERREAAKQQAVQVLNSVYYGNGISPTASGLPSFPAVQSPIDGGAATPGGYGPGSGGSSGSPWSAPGGAGPTGGAPTQSGVPLDGEAVGPAGSDGAPTTDPAAAADAALGGEDSWTPPDAPEAGSQTVAASAQPGGISGLGGTPGGAGGLGSGGVGSGGGGSAGGVGGIGGGSVPPSAAGSVVAGPGGAAGGRPTAAAMPGRPGAAGAGMGMAPMGGARGGNGDKDDEHKTPDYLKGDELQDWIHDGAVRAVTPVLGGETPWRTTDDESRSQR